MSSDAMQTVGLDTQWLAANIVHGGRGPLKVTFVGFIGTGQMSRNARFGLTWDDGSGPASVVVKLPSSEPGTRSTSFEHGAYEKECEFYRSIQPLVDVSVPECYKVYFDPAVQDFAIVLEDLAGSEQGDQFAEPTAQHLEMAVEQAAAFHAPVWGQVTGSAFASYHDPGNERSNAIAQLLPLFTPAVFDRLGGGLDDGIPDLINQFVALSATGSGTRGEPTTLVHGDFRPDNFMYGTDHDAPALAIVDWQTLSLGTGVTDVAYLLGGALKPETRRAAENDVLTSYVRHLAGRGVEYDMADCERDYALGSLHGIVISILATTMADQTERGDALFTLMLNRHGQHALDLGALDLLKNNVA